MTLTGEDLLVATGARTHEDFIISTWLAGYREPHRSMSLIQSQGTGMQSGPDPIVYITVADLFQSHY